MKLNKSQKGFKWLVAAGLSVVVTILSVPLGAHGNILVSGDFEYNEQSDGSLNIVGYNGTREKVVIPSKIDGKKVTSFSLKGYTSITSVTIPDSITQIYKDGFSGCSSLVEINVSADNEYYSSVDGVLYDKEKTELIICPEGKESITIPDTVNFGKGYYDFFFDFAWGDFSAVMNCGSLTEINVSDENQRYSSADGILYNKDKTVLLVCPRGKKGNITIPEGVEVIGEGAFYDCAFITSVNIPDSLLGMLAYYEIPVIELLGKYAAFNGCLSLYEINVDINNQHHKSVDGVLFDKEMTRLLCYPAGKKDNSYTIPEGVEKVEDYAFVYCRNLDLISIPSSVNELCEAWKFYMDYKTDWIRSTFDYCSSLLEINVSGENETYKSIDGVLYSKDEKNLIVCPGGKKDIFSVPKSVNTIYSSAFVGCSDLTYVYIPNNITNIEFPFSHCGNLPDICGIKGSFAEKYAKEHRMNFMVVSSKTYIDDNFDVRVDGCFTPEAVLTIEKIQDASDKNAEIYDITFSDGDGNTIQPFRAVTVKLPVPKGWDGEKCRVYRVEKYGVYTDMNAVCFDGYMSFATDHFSAYVLSPKTIENNGNEYEEPKTSESEKQTAVSEAEETEFAEGADFSDNNGKPKSNDVDYLDDVDESSGDNADPLDDNGDFADDKSDYSGEKLNTSLVIAAASTVFIVIVGAIAAVNRK